jgi:hypothetical protein
VGAYSFQLLPVHVNGVAQRAGYLAGLRVNWPYRHRLRILRNGYASIRALAGPDAVPLWFTSVASDNAPARRLLEAGLAGMPVYRPVGELHTLAMATCRGRARGLLRRAQRRDAAALAEFFNRRATAYQFSPVLTEDWLLSLSGHNGLRLDDFWLLWDGQRLRGCLAIWDQREFKQAVARGYRFPLNALRSSYDLWAALTRRVQLPRPGQKLEQVFLPFVAFDEGVGGAAPDAVGEGLALARDKDARAGVLGLSSENPLAAALKDAFNAHVYRTCIETVGWQDAPGTALDGRPPQPEVALL